MNQFDEETKPLLRGWLKFLLGTILVCGLGGGILFLTFKYFTPTVNQLDYNSRKTDPQVINTIQTQLIADLTSITKKQEEIAKLKAENSPAVPSAKASLQAMIDEMIERSQSIHESKVPPKVLAFIAEYNKSKQPK